MNLDSTLIQIFSSRFFTILEDQQSIHIDACKPGSNPACQKSEFDKSSRYGKTEFSESEKPNNKLPEDKENVFFTSRVTTVNHTQNIPANLQRLLRAYTKWHQTASPLKSQAPTNPISGVQSLPQAPNIVKHLVTVIAEDPIRKFLAKNCSMVAAKEVNVLKEEITELMGRISKFEYEDHYLRATATQQIIDQLNQSQLSSTTNIEYLWYKPMINDAEKE
ncbi:hypothetical protein CDAR_449731 [Caerostris darwini]|uniref:Uncharacterized protein n=1 Tax=Caerostris darwini TaxID=1538125 RepID=A0AAV4QS15_9ARAC|nr:hypothetical protein CDAR_449731 [Caerostris darwini]